MVTQAFSIYRRALPQKLCQFHQKFWIELQQKVLKSEKNHELGEFLEISFLTFHYNSQILFLIIDCIIT